MSKLLLLRLATGAAVAGLLAVSGLPARRPVGRAHRHDRG